MSWLFGSSKKNKAAKEAAAEPAVTKVQRAGATMDKRIELLEKKIEAETALAKQKVSKGDRNGAKMCLMRKKTYEEQLNKLLVQRTNLEHLQMTHEQAIIDMEAFQAQQAAAAQLRKVYNGMSAEQVDAELDHVRDAVDDARVISDALAQPLGDVVDEGELEAELGELEQQDLDEKMLAAKAAAKTKTKTKAKAAREEDDLEKELDALQAPSKGRPEEQELDEEAELAKLQAELA
jgi:charged multivesicular body protein 4